MIIKINIKTIIWVKNNFLLFIWKQIKILSRDYRGGNIK